MTSTGAEWIRGVDLSFVDARFGVEAVNSLLRNGRDHSEPPHVDDAGRLCAALVRDRRDPVPRAQVGESLPVSTALRIRVRDGALEVSCACSRGRPYVCEHVTRVLVDVAVFQALREALASRSEASVALLLLRELGARRTEAYETRTLDERLAQWLPARTFDDDLAMDIEPVRSAGLAAADERPALAIRHRRLLSRVLVKPHDVQAARLSPRQRRIVELTSPSHTDRSVLISTRAQASMLLHLVHHESQSFTGNFQRRLKFSLPPAAPRLERSGDRLVARWYTADGVCLADAADTLLFAGPFPYVWCEESEVFHPVASDVDLDAAWGLNRVPSLPLATGAAEKIGRALWSRGQGLGVEFPPPEVFGLPPLETPSFELTLTGTPLDVRGELFAVYRAGTRRVAPNAPVGDGCDREAEARALECVRVAGLTSDPEDAGDEATVRAVEDGAVHLWQIGLPLLRVSEEPRIELRLAESLARVRIGPPVVVHVRASVSSGWLDTKLEFTAGALAIELGRLREVLASKGRWVALTDGTLARLSEEVALLVQESLALFDDQGEARLAAHHVGRVARWIERHGGHADEAFSAMHLRLRALDVRASPTLPSRLDATLRPYQLSGIAWLQFLRELGTGGVLADDMGLGKTLMTLAFLARCKDDDGPRPSLVVCPTSVVGNWVSESARFAPQLRVLVMHGSSRLMRYAHISDSDLVITTYAILRRDAHRLASMGFRCAVLDEAQNVKNPTSLTSRAARGLNAEMRLALTGTPVENDLVELWSIMNFVNPGMLGTRPEFETRLETPIANAPTGPAREELRALVRPFILRRTKADVLPDLPPKTEIDRACLMGYRQKRLYDALALALRSAVKKDSDARGPWTPRVSVLTAILRLRQMACDPRLVDPSVLAGESAKRTVFLALVRELVADGRRALVFSQFVSLFTLWREDLDREGIAYEYLDGASLNRESTVDRFQKGSAPLFLISLKAGGAGLNLTAADTVIHCDPWWNPAVEDQATDRAHRMGQARAVTVIRLVAVGTIEDKIGLLKGTKRALVAAVMGDGARASDTFAVNAGLSASDVAFLLDRCAPGAMAATLRDNEHSSAPETLSGTRRFVPEREIDDLRTALRRAESRGMLRGELARRVGLPVARISLLLIGHRVPVPTRAADKIRLLLADVSVGIGEDLPVTRMSKT